MTHLVVGGDESQSLNLKESDLDANGISAEE